MNKEEIEKIIDSTESFNAYIEDISSLYGQALDLATQAAEVDGEEWTDQECLEIMKDIIDLTNAYANTHSWK